MKERGRLDGNTVVVTVMSNLGFMKYMQSLGIETARTATCWKRCAPAAMPSAASRAVT